MRLSLAYDHLRWCLAPLRPSSPPESSYRDPGRRDSDLRPLFVSGPEVTPFGPAEPDAWGITPANHLITETDDYIS